MFNAYITELFRDSKLQTCVSLPFSLSKGLQHIDMTSDAIRN